MNYTKILFLFRLFICIHRQCVFIAISMDRTSWYAYLLMNWLFVFFYWTHFSYCFHWFGNADKFRFDYFYGMHSLWWTGMHILKIKFTSLSFAIDWYLWNALVSLRCIIDIQGVCADSCALCSKTKTFKNSYYFGWSWSNCNQWCGCQNACSKCRNQASIFWCKYI